MDRREITEQLTVWCPEDDLTVEFDRPEVLVQKLPPRLRRRQDIEWLAVVRRAKAEPGGFGRLKATGGLVEIHGRWLSVARPSIAAALGAALEDELRRLLHEANPSDAQAGEHTDPP